MAATKQITQKEPRPPISSWFGPVVVGWLIPGGGHFLLKQRWRALLLFSSITLMFLFGLMMRGAMFKLEQADLYMLSNMLGYDQLDVAGHVHDYGTKFLVTAGLLNILAMVDAYEIATKKKS